MSRATRVGQRGNRAAFGCARGSRGVELLEEFIHQQGIALLVHSVQNKVFLADQLAAAHHEHLHACLSLRSRRCDEIHIDPGTPHDLLSFGHAANLHDAVADARGGFEIVLPRRLLHLGLKTRKQRLLLAFQKEDDLIDHRVVFALGLITDAWSQATFDVILEARTLATPVDRLAARTQREYQTDEIDQLAQSMGVRVGTEVTRAIVLHHAREHHAREGLVRHLQVRVPFVVAQTNVERRLMPLDQIRFENERFDFIRDDDRSHVDDPLYHRLRADVMACGVLEVRAHAVAQRHRLPNVKNVTIPVYHLIDAGRIGNLGEPLFERGRQLHDGVVVNSFEARAAFALNWPPFIMDDRIKAWKLPLRRWQRDAFEVWSSARPKDALIVATPGAGKTRFAARLAHAALAERSVRRLFIVVPREHLKAQTAIALAQAGVRVDHRFENSAGALASDVHGAVVTYQQLASAPALYRRLTHVSTLVVLDEIHHAGDAATWGNALREAFGNAAHRISLSGTPFRSDGSAIPFVRYERGECVADFSYDYAAALRDGVCRPLIFPLQGGYAEWVGKDGEMHKASFDQALRSKSRMSERLRTVLVHEAWIGDVITKAHERLMELRRGDARDAAGLMIAMNQEHARFLAGLLRARTGVEPAVVLSDEDNASRKIAAFARSNDPWIVAVHMVSEGVDIPRSA